MDVIYTVSFDIRTEKECTADAFFETTKLKGPNGLACVMHLEQELYIKSYICGNSHHHRYFCKKCTIITEQKRHCESELSSINSGLKMDD